MERRGKERRGESNFSIAYGPRKEGADRPAFLTQLTVAVRRKSAV